MAKIKIASVCIGEGPTYLEINEDNERREVWDCFAAATTADGRDFVHLVPFRHRTDERLARLVARIDAARVIDTDHWVELEPRTSLEDRWDMMAQQEDEVRHGLRSEDDMYHGIPYR